MSLQLFLLPSAAPYWGPSPSSFSPQPQRNPAEDPLWEGKGPGPRKGVVLTSLKDNSQERGQRT